MGVKGLHSYIVREKGLSNLAERVCLSKVEAPCTIIVDASALLYELCTKTHQKELYADYANLHKCATDFCASFGSSVQLTFVFDGHTPFNKLVCKLDRLNCQVHALQMRETGKTSEDRFGIIVPPLLSTASLRQAILDCGRECIQAIGEADQTIAQLASKRNAYILTNDTDFLIFNAGKGVILLSGGWCTSEGEVFAHVLRTSRLVALLKLPSDGSGEADCMPLLAATAGFDLSSGTASGSAGALLQVALRRPIAHTTVHGRTHASCHLNNISLRVPVRIQSPLQSREQLCEAARTAVHTALKNSAKSSREGSASSAAATLQRAAGYVRAAACLAMESGVTVTVCLVALILAAPLDEVALALTVQEHRLHRPASILLQEFQMAIRYYRGYHEESSQDAVLDRNEVVDALLGADLQLVRRMCIYLHLPRTTLSTASEAYFRSVRLQIYALLNVSEVLEVNVGLKDSVKVVNVAVSEVELTGVAYASRTSTATALALKLLDGALHSVSHEKRDIFVCYSTEIHYKHLQLAAVALLVSFDFESVGQRIEAFNCTHVGASVFKDFNVDTKETWTLLEMAWLHAIQFQQALQRTAEGREKDSAFASDLDAAHVLPTRRLSAARLASAINAIYTAALNIAAVDTSLALQCREHRTIVDGSNASRCVLSEILSQAAQILNIQCDCSAALALCESCPTWAKMLVL